MLSTGAAGQVENLRITEVSPFTVEVEVTNTGPAFTTSQGHPFCHLLNYQDEIPKGTAFGENGIEVFGPIRQLNPADSDLWLYISPPFTDGKNMIHGLKYGPRRFVGRSFLAAQVGL